MHSLSHYRSALMQELGLRFSPTRKIVTRPLVRGTPKVELAVSKATDLPGRVPAAERLIAAYKRAAADESSAKLVASQTDLWTRIVQQEFSELIELLSSEDAPGLARYLMHFGEKYTWFGGLTLSVDGYNRKRDESSVAISYLDKLICLAEAFNVLAVENPEQTERWGSNIYSNIDEVVSRIESMFNMRLTLQEGLIHTVGIKTDRGPLHYRHLNSAYAALRIHELLYGDEAICEYGGGFGLVAYYANRLKYLDYTIFDLPLVNVIAGSFLINALGPEAVSLYGEVPRIQSVKVYPYWACLDSEDGRFMLALNQDSLPEIEPNLANAYLNEIERTTRRFFLSINQEAQASMGAHRQNSVAALAASRPRFRRTYRTRYWMREGYVEELFSL